MPEDPHGQGQTRKRRRRDSGVEGSGCRRGTYRGTIPTFGLRCRPSKRLSVCKAPRICPQRYGNTSFDPDLPAAPGNPARGPAWASRQRPAPRRKPERMSGEIEPRAAESDFGRGRVTAEFPASLELIDHAPCQSNVPPKHRRAIIKATRERRKRPRWHHILSRPRLMLS